mmetsp:Transcript_11763/g.19575  ORF Transcript_11763/g.19575 Transcript_11763/m.19575 type:complete len:400 (-) Transcript_11763:330-1529(-)
MPLETCGEFCGWAAAVVACLAFGSFGVPVKGSRATRVDIDPLVMQSFKTFMCFATCWVVLLLGEEFTFTPWGIVSGLFWVPAGTAAIFAIRNAGLAVSQGIWSALIVLVSFCWGIFIFDEAVASRYVATLAILLMTVGLLGMSQYSVPDEQLFEYTSASSFEESEPIDGNGEDASFHDDDAIDGSIEMEKNAMNNTSAIDGAGCTHLASRIDSLLVSGEKRICHDVHFLGFNWSRRRLGLACAVFNGFWGGSIMVPMHYSSGNTTGLGYAVSFAIGASIVLLVMWAGRYLYHVGRSRSFVKGFDCLPSFHLRVMWLPGGIAGGLWSLGNICSMLSVQGLGEGVGYSVVQGSMLVSGLWGVYFYREVTKRKTRLKWLASAVLTVSGILLLSYEHRQGTNK